MLTSTSSPVSPATLWSKRALVGLLYLISFYLVFTIYAQGEVLFALLTLVVVTSGIFVFSSERAYRWRYLFPGVSAIGVFVVFPLVCTVVIAFTNYSGSNQLNFERVVSQLQSQRYFSGERYDFKLLETADSKYQLLLENKNSQQNYLSAPLALNDLTGDVKLEEVAALPESKVAPLKTITQNRQKLQSVNAILPNEASLTMSSLRQFSQQSTRFSFDEASKVLTNNETGERYKPNDDVGFFEQIDEQGNFTGKRIEPGYTVAIG